MQRLYIKSLRLCFNAVQIFIFGAACEGVKKIKTLPMLSMEYKTKDTAPVIN